MKINNIEEIKKRLEVPPVKLLNIIIIKSILIGNKSEKRTEKGERHQKKIDIQVMIKDDLSLNFNLIIYHYHIKKISVSLYLI